MGCQSELMSLPLKLIVKFLGIFSILGYSRHDEVSSARHWRFAGEVSSESAGHHEHVFN